MPKQKNVKLVLTTEQAAIVWDALYKYGEPELSTTLRPADTNAVKAVRLLVTGGFIDAGISYDEEKAIFQAVEVPRAISAAEQILTAAPVVIGH